MFNTIWNIWNEWNIRGFVMSSLLLQIFLILFAPLRKKIANHHILSLLWLTYLMADWVASFAIGIISNNQGNSCPCAAEVDGALQAFWGSFLLLHLGGPDTIVAFSLEDSSLWPRHLLGLIFQVSAAIYIFVQIFPSDKSLVIPTMLIFLAGLIKNAERTLALNLSSLPRLREWVYSQNMISDDADNELVEELDVQVEEKEEAKLAESLVVKHAYYFFQISKVFLIDFIYTGRQREISRKYFRKVSAIDALRVISVELQFMYEVLYTKALAIRSKWSYIFRFIAFTKVAMAFVLFNRLKKPNLPELDVEITYCLLLGGIALDLIALVMLVFSDWTVARIKWYKPGSLKLDSFLRKLVSATDVLRKPQFATCEAKSNAGVTYAVLNTPFIFQRWSESICACNLISEFLKESPRKMYKHDRRWGIVALSSICNFPFHIVEKIISCFHQAGEKITRGCGLRNTDKKLLMISNTRYVSKNPFIKKLWIFIFEEVRRKSKDAGDHIELRKIFEARGDMFLKSSPAECDCSNLLEYIEDTFDFNIITWHLATEICYNWEKPFASTNDEREFSKILSDYMLYLLLNQPDVVSAVAGIAQMHSESALLPLRRQFGDATEDLEGLCKRLYGTPSKNPYSASLSNRGTNLARKMEIHGERKWKVMSGVWVEMLSYTAIHIKGEAHVRVLSQGGELLAFVWLLMLHFGCLYKPEWGGMYNGFFD